MTVRTTQTHIAIETNGRFQVLNLNSKCAYGDFDSRDEAEAAIIEALRADQSIGGDQ